MLSAGVDMSGRTGKGGRFAGGHEQGRAERERDETGEAGFDFDPES